MIFDDSNLHDVVFVRCDLREAKFNNAKFGRVRFIESGRGATFDAEPSLTSDDAEISLVSRSGDPEETYRKKHIKQALTFLRGEVAKGPQKPLPPDMGERAALAIFRSLYKSDEIRLDYPELRKIENSLRAWLREYNLSDDHFSQYMSLFIDLYEDLERTGWICSNPARTRTRVPCEARVAIVGQIVRSGSIPIHLTALRELVGKYNQRAGELPKGAPH